MTKRLTIWGFDNVLVDTDAAYQAYGVEYDFEPLWFDPNTSTDLAQLTEPLPKIWALLAETPGDHIILTGRVLAAVLAWLSWNGQRPEVSAGISKITEVICTLGGDWPVEDVGARKALDVLSRWTSCKYDEVYVYESNPAHLRLIASICPKAKIKQVFQGDVLQDGWTWRTDPDTVYPPT